MMEYRTLCGQAIQVGGIYRSTKTPDLILICVVCNKENYIGLLLTQEYNSTEGH